ncbi:hypothetical protein RAS1_02340 [Phycisphaerae bacterium RAS1]|nr:hypothetical protein RAS1_02340 [Phycisphaerae bacterium RAS1]
MILVGADVHVRNSFLYSTDFDGKRLGHGRVSHQGKDSLESRRVAGDTERFVMDTRLQRV